MKTEKAAKTVSHTPGPWEARGILDRISNGKPYDFYPIHGGGRDIGSVLTETHQVFPNPNGQADARLIAAAPDLLAAAKMEEEAQAVEQAASKHLATWMIEDAKRLRIKADTLRRAAIAKAEGR